MIIAERAITFWGAGKRDAVINKPSIWP